MFQFNKLDKNSILVGIAILAIIVTGVLIFANLNYGNVLSFLKLTPGMSAKVIAQKSVDYLNSSVLQQGQTATLVSFSEESGVVKMNIKIGVNSYTSYATKDGKLLFPEALTIDIKTEGQPQTLNQPAKQTPTNLTKVDKPLLETYIVSRCPYGLQMQRAVADAIKNIPSLAEFIKVRYIGSIIDGKITAMHGDAEAKENLRQICIREEQPAKYWSYVACQMKNGDTAGCLALAGVDSPKLNVCVADSKRGLAYAQKDFTSTSKHNIQSSPTLVLNGVRVSEFDFGGRSSDAIKTIICDSSKAQPSFCSNKLNTDQAATSFSLTYAGSSNSGSTTNGGSSCAPAQ